MRLPEQCFLQARQSGQDLQPIRTCSEARLFFFTDVITIVDGFWERQNRSHKGKLSALLAGGTASVLGHLLAEFPSPACILLAPPFVFKSVTGSVCCVQLPVVQFRMRISINVQFPLEKGLSDVKHAH